MMAQEFSPQRVLGSKERSGEQLPADAVGLPEPAGGQLPSGQAERQDVKFTGVDTSDKVMGDGLQSSPAGWSQDLTALLV